MPFADNYFSKFSLYPQFINENIEDDVKIIVVIPILLGSVLFHFVI